MALEFTKFLDEKVISLPDVEQYHLELKDDEGLRSYIPDKHTHDTKFDFQGGSTIDHIIWDHYCQVSVADGVELNSCGCLNLWTEDLEFSLIIFSMTKDDNAFYRLTTAYLPFPDKGLLDAHGKYLNYIVDDKNKEWVKKFSTDLKRNLPKLISWNLYSLDKTDIKPEKITFKRSQALAIDPSRKYLQSIPTPNRFLYDDEEVEEIEKLFDHIKIDHNFNVIYERVKKKYFMGCGIGNPVKRNILTLSSLMSDSNIKTVLITGEPGTGKENLCKAVYYGRHSYHNGADNKHESIFKETTAMFLESQMKLKPPKSPSESLKNLLNNSNPENKLKAFFFIDELNKVEKEFLVAMLRPLEQGKEELDLNVSPVFILAASQHIETLASTPPQDFWTRISHQLRVIHPLSMVDDNSAEAFLKSFFYINWVQLLSSEIKKTNEPMKKHLERVFLGEQRDETYIFSNLCSRVRNDFINTLVPLVTRDTLSIRAARSIVVQIFEKVNWYARFDKPNDIIIFNCLDSGGDLEGNYKGSERIMVRNDISRLVNSAVQDVLIILNASRNTPSALEK